MRIDINITISFYNSNIYFFNFTRKFDKLGKLQFSVFISVTEFEYFFH